MGKFYGHTNESLWSIVSGLDASRKDRVLCISGSGDQAFALAEYAGEVVAVDKEVEQIKYSTRRLKALEDDNYDDFFPLFDDRNFPMILNEKFVTSLSGEQKLKYLYHMTSILGTKRDLATWSGSVKYFLGDKVPFSASLDISQSIFDRLNRIKENLSKISFREEDIIHILEEDVNFSRVYLSNAFLSWRFHDSQSGAFEFLNRLPKDCLVYSTETGDTSEMKHVPCWELDKLLTKRAKKLELFNAWTPRVYRKLV